jgi:hypothetical protein
MKHPRKWRDPWLVLPGLAIVLLLMVLEAMGVTVR